MDTFRGGISSSRVFLTYSNFRESVFCPAAAEPQVELEIAPGVLADFVSRFTIHQILNTSAWGDLAYERDETLKFFGHSNKGNCV